MDEAEKSIEDQKENKDNEAEKNPLLLLLVILAVLLVVYAVVIRMGNRQEEKE